MKGFLSPFSECVQYIDSFGKLCNIEYTILLSRMNSDFNNSRSDRGHRLPVGGRTATLDFPELKSCFFARIVWKFHAIRQAKSQARPEVCLPFREYVRIWEGVQSLND